LVRKLFALEVPEIASGQVEIVKIAREAGHRTKIAVQSHQQGVNAKGACIGPVGSRVRNVMAELHGEKIDIVDFSEDPAEFVANALSPARVTRVDIVDPVAMEARVIVPDYQLSLAIGKEGQNARLAARLTGWRIDIRSDAAVAEAASGGPGESGESGASDAPADAGAGSGPDAGGAAGSERGAGAREARSVPREARSVPRQGREAARDAGAGKVGGNAGTASAS
jgi:N utilization substance protein A